MPADLLAHPHRALERDELGIRLTVADVRTFLIRGRWVIAGVFLLTTLTAYSALSLMTELYEVRSALLVKLGRENLDAPATARNTVLSTGVRREELGSEVQILKSSDLAAQVVDEVGLEAFRPYRVVPDSLLGKAKFYAKAALRWAKDRGTDALIALDLQKRLGERDMAIASITDKLAAEPQKDSDVILLRLSYPDPVLAVRVQETLIAKYLSRRTHVRHSPGVKEFFDDEAVALKARLDRAEQTRNDWKRQRDLSLPAEQKALLLQRITALSTERGRTLSKATTVSREMAAAESIIHESPDTVRASHVETPNPSVQFFTERLTKLEAEHAHALTTYTPTAPPVLALEEEIASLRRLIETQERTLMSAVTSERNPLRQQLQQSVHQDRVELEGLSASATFQRQELRDLQAQLKAIEDADATLVALDRERAIAEQNYLTAVKRQADSHIESQLDLSRISNVSVAMPPVATLFPVYPRKLLIMALALVAGLVLGLLAALLLEWTSDELYDIQATEAATNLVCLGRFGTVPDGLSRQT